MLIAALLLLLLDCVLQLPQRAGAETHYRQATSRSDNEIEYGRPTPVDPEDSRPYDQRLELNVSRILDSLIASHDRRIRPNYGGPPTEVNVTAHIITISAISEVSMDYTIDLYLRQFWRDARLAFSGLSEGGESTSLTVGIDMVRSIWTPDTFFPNEKKSFFHDTTSHNSFLRIDNHGNVIRSIRLTVTANCPMNLHTVGGIQTSEPFQFPLDQQICALEIESYGYSTADIIYHWHHHKPVIIDENVHLAHFTIGDHFHVERMISLSTGNYSRLTTYFKFKRSIGFYLIQVYLPSSLIVIISWVSFWLNREATQARVAIGVTTVLTQTTLMTSTNASLPKVSYVKSLDIFLGVCFFIVFASLLEYAAVGYMMKRQRAFRGGRSNSQLVYYYEFEDQSQVRVGGKDRRRESSIKHSRHLNGGLDQAIPLLSLSPTNSNQLGTRLSVTEPLEPTKFLIRPSQVDLFSRIAFPLFFLLFHIAYWTVYMNAET